jgi:hypothetical protein
MIERERNAGRTPPRATQVQKHPRAQQQNPRPEWMERAWSGDKSLLPKTPPKPRQVAP